VPTISRRQFLTQATGAMAGLVLPRKLCPQQYSYSEPLPASLARIATWWRPTNPIWYETDGGFIHSGYVQPVENRPSDEIIQEVAEPGFWADVCVPMIESRPKPGSPYVTRTLYYATVYRVIGAVSDSDGAWWYQLKEGITWSPGPYVPSWSMRRITPEQMAPISPGQPDKRIEINIDVQLLTCYEGDRSVFATRISSGLSGTATPRGEHRLVLKRGTSRMTGGSGSGYYDLPGVPFPAYFTWNGVAIHGTYWHNDYGRRHSHGCVNVTPEAALWIFRWCDPPTAYTDSWVNVPRDEGTPILVA
jgi:hypothetical protein